MRTITITAPGPQGIQGQPGAQGDSVFSSSPSGVWSTTASIQISGSFTVSGSSTFTNIGPAIFSGSVTTTGGFTGSLLGTSSFASTAGTANAVGTLSQDVTISGNLNVIGTASYAYITASQLNVQNNIISVNTNNPSVRFGGLTVVDSGSFGNSSTGSILWDSLYNRWIYSNPSGSSYDGGMLISGPRNTSGLGNETGTTTNALMKGQGGDHITSSGIFEDASGSVTFGNNLMYISSSGRVGIGTNAPSEKLEIVNGHVKLSANYSVYTNTVASANASNTNLNLNGTTGVTLGLHNANMPFMIGVTGGAEVMRISGSGNVGIGTTTPTAKLELNQSASGVTTIAKFGSSFQGNYVTVTVGDLYAGSIAGYQNASTKRWELTNGGDLTLNHPSATPGISGNGQLRLSGPTTVAVTSGNFLVGTTTDSGYKLDVSGSISSTTVTGYNSTTTDGNIVMRHPNSAAAAIGVTSDSNLRIKAASMMLHNGTAEMWFGRYNMASIQAFSGDFGVFTSGDAERLRIKGTTGETLVSGSLRVSGSIFIEGPTRTLYTQAVTNTTPDSYIYIGDSTRIGTTGGSNIYYASGYYSQAAHQFFGGNATNMTSVVDIYGGQSGKPALRASGSVHITGSLNISTGITMPNFTTITSQNNQINFETFRTIFYTSANTVDTQYGFNFDDGGGNNTSTSGTTGRFQLSSRFGPTSGTAVYNTFLLNTIVNQTGGANGITRGLYINPTLTSAADFRAIETTAGNVLFQSGSTPLLFVSRSGNVGIGTASPTQNLDVNGTARINGDLTIGTLASTNTISFGGGVNNTIFRDLAEGSMNFRNTFSNAVNFRFRTNSDVNNQNTSGTNIFMSLPIGFTPSSGTGTWTQLSLTPTINQTGGANGITRGLYIAPTLTSAADWRSIETTAGNVLFGASGTGLLWDNANNRLSVGIAAPAQTLEIWGTGYISGRVGIGSAYPLSTVSLQVTGQLTGGVISYGVRQSGYVQTDTTLQGVGFGNQLNKQSVNTLSTYYNYLAYGGGVVSGTVTNQMGFAVTSNLTNATNNYAFHSELGSGSGNWNLYMIGGASNYMSGSVLIGTTTNSGYKLDVSGSTFTRKLIVGTDNTYTGAVTGSDFYMKGTSAGITFTVRDTNNNTLFAAGGASGTGQFYSQAYNIGLGTSISNTANKVHILSNGTTSATTALLVQNSTPTTLFQIQDHGSSSFAGNMTITGSVRMSGSAGLTVIGSGSTVLDIQGSQGQLFSITDSLSGSLFSVNDISGLPILEVFSDGTTLIGDYLDPALITTTRKTANTGITTIYSLPTSSYDGAWFDYTIRSGSDARVGTVMGMWSGTTVNYTETSASQFGNTSGFVFGMSLSGSNMILSGSATTSGWAVKTIIRSI